MEMYFLVIKVVKGDKDLVFFAKFKRIRKKKIRKKLDSTICSNFESYLPLLQIEKN